VIDRPVGALDRLSGAGHDVLGVGEEQSGHDGSRASWMKTELAASIVASWSSSLEPKCANKPLVLIPTASASRLSESPAMVSVRTPEAP
jgi:hypothetical protein